MERLPIDSLCEISQHFRYRDLLQARSFCSIFHYHLRLRYLKTKKVIPEDRFPYLETIKGAYQDYDRYRNLRSLSIGGGEKIPFVGQLPNLERLLISGYGSVEDVGGFPKLTMLKCSKWAKGIDRINLLELTISNLDWGELDPNRPFNSIKKLIINSIYGYRETDELLVRYFPNVIDLSLTNKFLRHLDLAGLNLISLTTYNDFGGPRFDQITSLERLSGNHFDPMAVINNRYQLQYLEISESGIEGVDFTTFTKLTEIESHGCWFDHPPILPDSITKLTLDYWDDRIPLYPNLRALSVMFDESHTEQLAVLPLESLELFYNGQEIQNTQFLEFNNPHLKNLSLHGFNIEGINCPRLERLTLSRGVNIGSLSIASLRALELCIRLPNPIDDRRYHNEIKLPRWIEGITIELLRIEIFAIDGPMVRYYKRVIDPSRYPNIRKIKYLTHNNFWR